MTKHSKKVKQAYQEIADVCEKHIALSDNHYMRDIKTMLDDAKNHVAVEDWREKYNIEITHDKRVLSQNYIKMSEYIVFSYYKDGEADREKGGGKYISWSEDKRQPKDEWLLVISFSTGAYIFGEDYEGQKQLFIDFFRELESHNPKYSDIVNHALYWSMDDAGKIYNEFQSILNKYRERNKAELKQRKIESLKKELANLDD